MWVNLPAISSRAADPDVLLTLFELFTHPSMVVRRVRGLSLPSRISGGDEAAEKTNDSDALCRVDELSDAVGGRR
jgi:hypothetical protein